MSAPVQPPVDLHARIYRAVYLSPAGAAVEAVMAVVEPELAALREQLTEARQQFAAVAAQRDRLRTRMNNLADRWDAALAVDKPYARALRAEISVAPFNQPT